MQLFKESTKFKPLLFFETFLNKETLMKYEDNFYNHTNNSQVNYREQGFIEYYKDSYKLNEPVTLVRVYFKDYFEMFLTTQVTKTLSLIEIRTDDLDYDITKINFFITKQLIIIQNLKDLATSISVYGTYFLKALDKVKTILLKNELNKTLVNNQVTSLTNRPFFEPKIRKASLKKLYDIALDNKLIDEEIVFQEDFINVFTSNTPKKLEKKIYFICDNLTATFFLNSIMVYFNNLSHSSLTKSECFYNERNKLLNQNDFDKAKTTYTKKDNLKKEFLSILKDLQGIKHP